MFGYKTIKQYLKTREVFKRKIGSTPVNEAIYLIISAEDWDIVGKATTMEKAREQATKRSLQLKQGMYVFKSEVFLKHTLVPEIEEVKMEIK